MILTIISWILKIAFLLFVFVCFYTKGKLLHSFYLWACDLFHRDWKSFSGYGFHLYCGLGGSGKTLSMVEYLYRVKAKYPLVKVYTTFTCDVADGIFSSWDEMISLDNGKDGVVFGFDEIHLTFNSQKWGECPENLLFYISQQRKLHKQIVASAQVFSRVNIILREQSNYVIECKSAFGGRWIFNKAFITEEYLANSDKKDKGQKKRRRAWRHSFVGTDKLRSLYDTNQVMFSIDSVSPVKQKKRN